MKLETVVIPVSDVDRAKEFYESLGWRLDADFAFDNGFRVVQFTPPGLRVLDPVRHEPHVGRARLGPGPVLVVSDIEAARDELVAHGVDASEVFHAGTPGAQFQPRRHERSRERAGARSRHATARSRRSATRTATAGCCRRSRPGCPAAIDAADDGVQLRRQTWRARSGGRRPRTASTRSARASAMRTGRTGTPRTWWRSRPATSFRRDRLRRHRPRRRRARRALRRRAGGGRSARRRRRTRARRWRVLLLGVHPVQDPASPG